MARIYLHGTMARCVVLAVFLALPLVAQQNNQERTTGRANAQQSGAYRQGYNEGLRDRDRNFEPSPGYASSINAADRRAYRDGYRAGYCKDEDSRTGYYNGIYRNYSPPVVRNGYYGYNAHKPFCEATKDSPLHDDSTSQGRVEYGGAG